MPLLIKDCKNPNQVIVTIAALSTITHLLKIFVFLGLGFAFFDYIDLMFVMIFGAIFGSFLGTKVRKRINVKKLLFLIKILLCFFALKSIITSLI